MKRTLTLSLIAALMICGFQANAKKLSEAQIKEKIEGYMEECMTNGLSVVMVKGDKVVYQNAFGWKDKEAGIPLDINDIFRIASISKSFSGVSIMQLVEAGKISLEDDVNDILGMNIRNPRYPDIPITVKMLLSHTSSMKDGGGAARYTDLTYIDESKTPIEEIRDKSYLPYAPGQGYKYCNRALNTIGVIIEKVSGERFDNYVLNHILRPMGLSEKEAGYNVDTLDNSKFTSLYIYNKKTGGLDKSQTAYARKRGEKAVENGTYVIGRDGHGWSPTGGMKISAPNLAKWMMTLRDGGIAPNGTRILSEKGMKKLLTPVTPADEGTQYCLTTRTETRFIDGKTLKGHTGSAQGLKSCMFFCPEEDWGFVCIASSTDPDMKINEVYKIYYKTVNLIYDQYIKGK